LSTAPYAAYFAALVPLRFQEIEQPLLLYLKRKRSVVELD
jgi:hypothetical protein